MTDSTSMTVRVSTDKLLEAASDVENKVKQLEQVFMNVEQTIRTSQAYWEGDGNTSYIESYKRKTDMTAAIFRRFRENVTDLRTIAGIYKENEINLTESSQRLPTNLID